MDYALKLCKRQVICLTTNKGLAMLGPRIVPAFATSGCNKQGARSK